MDEEYPNIWTPIAPNGQTCKHTGLGHGQLYGMLKGSDGGDPIAKGHVRVASLRRSGRGRGKTVFHVGDMMRFLDKLAKEQEK